MQVRRKIAIPRIPSLDLMRGWFLCIIILDHLSYFPNGFSFVTGDSRLFVTAAEGFFLISGLVLGIVRGAKLVDAPFKEAAKKLLVRSGTLYLTSIVVSTLLLIISWQFIGNDGVKSPIPPPGSNLLELAWHTITLQEFYGWADYLRLYAIFIFVSPLFLWLLRKGKWHIALIASAAVWLLTPRPVSELAQPLTWQFLFFIAFTVGFYWPSIIAWWHSLKPHRMKLFKRTILAAFIVTLSLNVIGEFAPPNTGLPVIQAITDAHSQITPYMRKNDLNLPRLSLALLWFTGFYFVFRRFEATILKYLGWLFIPFGINSLYVYTMHAFLITFTHLIVNPMYGNPPAYFNSFDRLAEIPFNMAISLAVVGIIYFFVRIKFLMKIIPR